MLFSARVQTPTSLFLRNSSEAGFPGPARLTLALDHFPSRGRWGTCCGMWNIIPASTCYMPPLPTVTTGGISRFRPVASGRQCPLLSGTTDSEEILLLDWSLSEPVRETNGFLYM